MAHTCQPTYNAAEKLQLSSRDGLPESNEGVTVPHGVKSFLSCLAFLVNDSGRLPTKTVRALAVSFRAERISAVLCPSRSSPFPVQRRVSTGCYRAMDVLWATMAVAHPPVSPRPSGTSIQG